MLQLAKNMLVDSWWSAIVSCTALGRANNSMVNNVPTNTEKGAAYLPYDQPSDWREPQPRDPGLKAPCQKSQP